jgi:hypothetical protein
LSQVLSAISEINRKRSTLLKAAPFVTPLFVDLSIDTVSAGAAAIVTGLIGTGLIGTGLIGTGG